MADGKGISSHDSTTVFDEPTLTIGSRLGHRDYIKEAFRHPDFIWRYPLVELRAKNRETILGIAWEMITPLLLVLTWWLIRGVVFPRFGSSDYLQQLIVGIFTYQYIQRNVTTGASSIDRSRSLMLSFNFPAMVSPVQHAIGSFFSNLPNILVMLVFVVSCGTPIQLSWVLLPAIIVLQALFSFGGSLSLARITVGNPDLRNTLPFIFRLIFYASGVVFPIEDRIRGKSIAWLFDLNPFYAIVNLTRWAVNGSTLHTPTMISAIAWGLLLPVIGYGIFRTGDHRYVE